MLPRHFSHPCLYSYADALLPPVDPNYECKKHGQCYHSLFGSYRVDPDKPSMKSLTQAIERAYSSLSKSLTMFWDAQCLPIGEDWEKGFLNCLRNSSVIILLVSRKAVKRCAVADTNVDNFLLEIDLAIDLHAAGKAVVIPVFMVQKDDKDFPGGHIAFLEYLQAPGTFPEKRAKHQWSSSKTIAATMRAVTQLPGAVNIFQDADFSAVADEIAGKCEASMCLMLVGYLLGLVLISCITLLLSCERVVVYVCVWECALLCHLCVLHIVL